MLFEKEVSRNWCLQRNITRLSAIILILKNKGYEFNPHWRGGDYVYTLVSEPKKNIPVIEMRDGRPVAVFN